ncbi:MAG: hypothetical protein IH591_12280 [Bacteroidales bacterium]|nr:hypothetical protein [Bacteroidales bacterium]
MIIPRFPLLVPVLTILIVSSCRSTDMKDIDQGEIHYSITYGGPSGSIPIELMPKTLIVSFKKDKILFDISSPIGNTGIANLANHEEGIYDTYISMFSGRFFYEGIADEVPPGMMSMEGMKINKTGRKAEIMGFNCEHAEVILPSMPDSVFEIWFTDELDITKPNAATPFREIEGVLLKFFFFMGEREFVFEAEGIYRKEIPEKVFQRREKYRRIPKENMDEYIIRLVNL